MAGVTAVPTSICGYIGALTRLLPLRPRNFDDPYRYALAFKLGRTLLEQGACLTEVPLLGLLTVGVGGVVPLI
jgi:hypothetical protein